MCTTARVCVCDCLYLKKKNEAERHLGSGLNGKSPYQVSAQQLKMQLNSLSSSSSSYSSRRRLLSSGLSSSFYCTHQTQLVGSRHFSGWHFHLLFLIFPLFFACVWYSPPPLHPFFCLFVSFSKKKTTSFFRWIMITKIWLCVLYIIFSENRLLSFLCTRKNFHFCFVIWRSVIYDTLEYQKIKRKENRNEFRS